MSLLRILSFAALIATSVTACAPTSPATRTPDRPSKPEATAQRQARTLVVAVRQEPANVAPLAPGSSGFSTNFAVRPFNAFLELVDDHSVPRPYLAEALPQLNTSTWQVFPDGRMETSYRLRPNLVWHDGTALSAEDFVFAWRVYMTPELGFPTSATAPLSIIEEVAAPTPSSIVIRWRRPFPSAGMLQVGGATNLGLPPLPRQILDAPYKEERWESFTNLPYWGADYVGLGPYRMDRWEPGTFLEGVAFDGHVLGRPRIERVRVVFIRDTNTAMANMRAGTVHFVTEQAVTFEQTLELKREWEASNEGVFLWMSVSMRHFVFQARPEYANPRGLLDVRVRRALTQSLDRASLNDTLYGGEATLLDSFFSPRLEYYGQIEAALTKYPYDLRATERLMTEAGYARGADGVYTNPTDGRMSVEILSTGAVADTERSIAGSGWRQVGFDAQEANVPPGLLLDGQTRATFPAVMTNAQNATQSTMATSFTTGQIARPDNRWNGINRGGWSNLDYDRAVDAFNTVLDPPERIRQRVAMARVLSEELPVIMLYGTLQGTPHLAVLTGPMPIEADTTGYTAWNLHDWELR